MKSYVNGEPAKLTKLKNNYWEYNTICCDCGLTHHHHFLLDKGELWMAVFRDDYNTAFERKRKKKK